MTEPQLPQPDPQPEPEKPKPRPLFPQAWRYYPAVVASLAAVLITLNALLVTTEARTQDWIAVAVSAVAALLIWIRARAKQLGITMNGKIGEALEAEADAAEVDVLGEVAPEGHGLLHLFKPRHGGKRKH